LAPNVLNFFENLIFFGREVGLLAPLRLPLLRFTFVGSLFLFITTAGISRAKGMFSLLLLPCNYSMMRTDSPFEYHM
jgi:hypothetical protein